MVRLLHVTIFEGVGVPTHKEPYACAELLDITGRPIKKERAKTSSVAPGTRLVWGSVRSEGASSLSGAAAAAAASLETKNDDDADDVDVESSLLGRSTGASLTLGRKHDLRNVGALPVLRLSLWGRELLTKDKPLGVALVDLASLPADGSPAESWQKMEPATGMDEEMECGRLKVSLMLDPEEANRIFYAGAAGPEGEGEGYVVGIEDGPGDEDEEYAESDPNLLMVRVRRAKSLIGLDVDLMGEPSSDPFVKVTCDGVEHRTATVEKNLSPEWDETFEFAVKDFTRRLDVEVMDADVVVDESMGSFTIKLEDLLHKRRVTRWYRLLGVDELYDEENPLGEIELSVQWLHDPRAKDLATRKLSLLEIVQRTLGLVDYSSDTCEELDGEDDGGGKKKDRLPKALKAKARDKAREAREAEKKAMQEELMDIEVKSGDYTIYVHIIEARDLKAEDVQGTSDPVVYVEAFGQKFATEVKTACLSCVFDETFVIGLRNLDKDLFEEGVIRVSVMDADGPVAIKNDLIGSYSFDAANVYFHRDHEIHRQWVALVDDENPRDSGTQGYLQLSIAIVGPGDKLKIHDEAEDRRKEREAEAKSGGIDGLVMIPPSVSTKTQWLVTTVWRAEYLPVMDTGPILTHGGDFFTMVTVSGGAPAQTKTKSMYGSRSSMAPVWRTQLWVPVSIPCMSGSVKTIVKDWDSVGEDEIVACVNCKLKEIESLPDRQHRPRWFPLYGAPLVVPTSTEIAEIALRMTGPSQAVTNWRSMYENLPQKASTYRGRILLSREIRESLPIGKEESTPWRRKVGRLPKKKEPSTTRFAMRCYVASGADVPHQSSVIRMGLNFKMSVRISIGSAVLETRLVENPNGVCEWGELLESKEPLELPSDPDQIPDAIVHLQRGDDKIPICFVRIPAKELLDQGMHGLDPRWLLLGEDKVLDCLPEGQYPGSLLIKLGLGTLRDFSESAAEWQAEALKLRMRTSYLLRVHIYQGRDLPAADSNGLMDPFLKMQCQGERLNTEEFMYHGKAVHRRRETVDPMWYFTWEADLQLPPQEMQSYFPQVSIQLMDYDPVGPNDYAGCMFLDLGSCNIDQNQYGIPTPPLPTWKSFFLEKPGDSSGELLVSYQLIKTTRPGLTLAPPPDLTPKLRSAHLEILALGIRGMQPFEMLPMQMPYMQLEVDLPNGKRVSLTTNPSKKPSGADANFLERLTVPLDLPVRDMFAPRLKLRVRDSRLGGFLTPVVGVGAVDLAKKLPWSRTFQHHSSRKISAMDVMGATGAPVFQGMFDQEDEEKEMEHARPGEGSAPPIGTPADANATSDARTNGGLPNGNGNGNGGGEAGGVAGGAGGALGASWADLSSGPETLTSNPLFRAPGAVEGGAAGGKAGAAAVGDVPAPEAEIAEIMGQEDEGAGVFGAILHEPVVREKVWQTAREEKSKRGENIDEDDGPPKYMVGRRTSEAELERELATKPFETYDLYRGQKFGGRGSADGEEGDYRAVGRFKCIIRVTVGDPDDEPMFAPGDKKKNEEILNELLLPKGYKLRLYCLQALNLTPMDMGIGGRPGKSDPYLKVKLGKEVFSDVDNYIDDVTDADLYRCVELSCELPGASQLQIDVMDYDDIGGDELIGRTVIDLEDRWFDQRWQAIGMEQRVEDMTDPEKMRWQVKPLENRSLYVPTSNAPQGVLQCWVDIMPPGDAKGFPLVDVSLPPDVEFEVRLVIWKCKDVVSMEFASGLNDLFVKSWLEGCEPQDTDTHWRAKGGKGSFNWRMNFRVMLGPRARTSKFPYLTLQMWDKDIFKWNDCIAEGMLDLGRHFRRAYKKKTDVLKLFESVQTERAKEAIVKTQQALKSEQTKALKYELQTQIANPLLGDIEDVQPDSPISAEAETGGGRPGGRAAAEEDSDSDGGGCCCFGGKKPMTPLELRAENDRRRTLGMPLLDEEAGLTAKEARKKRKEEGDEEVKELIQKIKVMTGISSDDPPDSQWISLEKTDRKTGRKNPMGKCLIGIQIFPVEKAEAQPAGLGRAEPNNSPFLPPPNGRLEFGWNPITMLSQLLGPRLCFCLCCCLCCGIIILSLIFLQPLWNLLIALMVN